MAHSSQINWLYMLLLGLAGLIIQAFFIPLLEIGVWRPDVIILIVIFIGFRYGVIPGILTGFTLGLFQDSLSPLPMGVSSLANSIIGFAAGQIQQLKFAYNAKILALVILILIQGLIFYFFVQIQSDLGYGYLILTRVFPNTIYTFLTGFLISVFIRKKIEEL